MQEWEYLGDLLALSDIQSMMLFHHVVEQQDATRIFGNVDHIPYQKPKQYAFV